MLFVRCIELGCVVYVSIGIVGQTFGWVGDEVVVGVGLGLSVGGSVSSGWLAGS